MSLQQQIVTSSVECKQGQRDTDSMCEDPGGEDHLFIVVYLFILSCDKFSVVWWVINAS